VSLRGFLQRILFFSVLVALAAAATRAEEVTVVAAPHGVSVQPLRAGLPRCLELPWSSAIEAPSDLAGATAILLPRGAAAAPGQGLTLRLTQPAWVGLAVHDRGAPTLTGWTDTGRFLAWTDGKGDLHLDQIVGRLVPAGEWVIPAHDGSMDNLGQLYGLPHLVLMRSTPPNPPAAPESRSARFAEFVSGLTLNNAHFTVTVSARPHLRIAALRDSAGRDWLRAYDGDTFWGIRTWLMEPAGQGPLAAALATLPATLTRTGPHGLTAETAPDPATGLSLTWTVELDPARPELHIRHTVRNHGPAPHTLALWPIVVVDPATGGETAAAAEPAPPTDYLMSPANLSPEAARGVHLRPGEIALTLPSPSPDAIKVGARHPAGWVEHRRPDGVLRSWVAFPEGGTIPEGGRNLTLYRSPRFAEIEHVGALQNLAPGDTTGLDQTLTLTTLSFSTALTP
jgi:hypothetical protein